MSRGADDSDLDDVGGVYLDDGEFLVGEAESDIVAMGAFRPADGGIEELFDGLRKPTVELKRMRVAPDHQRLGVRPTPLRGAGTTRPRRRLSGVVLDTSRF